MNPRRVAYILLAVSKGHQTVAEIEHATSLSAGAIQRTLRDHSKKLMVEFDKSERDGVIHYRLRSWGMLDGGVLQQKATLLASELGLPRIEHHPRNVIG